MGPGFLGKSHHRTFLTGIRASAVERENESFIKAKIWVLGIMQESNLMRLPRAQRGMPAGADVLFV
jgi:hypothetical protein